MPRSYKDRTLKLLFGTAAHCAYPGCASLIIFEDRGLLTPTAQIAHIRSESPEGPRHDPAYTGDINGFENLLLLCGLHHPPVDQHDSAYTIEELLEWKEQQKRQGDRLVRDADLAAIARRINGVPPVTSDAVLRGPIAHLGEAERLQQAEDRVVESPLEAASLFAEVASRLEASPFARHAILLRARQCEALESGGDFESAAALRLNLGWALHTYGNSFAVVGHIRKLDSNRQHLSESILRSISALSYVAAFGYDHSVGIDDVAAAFDALQSTDMKYIECALMLAEQCIVWRRADLLTTRMDRLRDAALTTPLDDDHLTIRARILMCLAEVADDWSRLDGARVRYPPNAVAWIAARHARHLAIKGRTGEALRRWQDAIDVAVQAGLNDSAASWLYATVWVARQNFGPQLKAEDTHLVAQALKVGGSGSVLPEPQPYASRAKSNILDKRWPDARHNLHQHLSYAVLGADWQEEFLAHQRFGDLYTETGQWTEAIRHYVYGSYSQKLKALVGRLPDEPLGFHPPSDDQPAWERAASFRFASVAAELIPEETAREWASASYRELTTKEFSRSPIDTWGPAFGAFAGTCGAASLEEAEGFLNMAQDHLSESTPDSFFAFYEEYITAAVAIAESHPSLSARVIDALCDAVLLNNHIADYASDKGELLFRSNPSRVSERLASAAAEGNRYAALTLVLAGSDVAPVLAVARSSFERDSQPFVFNPSVTTFGTTLKETALLVRTLDDTDRTTFTDAMLDRVAEVRDAAENRSDALKAILYLAPTLPAPTRSATFDALMSFVREPTESLVAFGIDNDPFARFKFTGRTPPLAALALRVAAALATTQEQFTQVQELAISLMYGARDTDWLHIAHALIALPVEALQIDLPVFAAHPNKAPRAFAARVWVRAPSQWPDLGVKLAKDPEPAVRYALASSLNDSPEHDEVRHLLQADHRRLIAITARAQAGRPRA
ncbi:hypothetical protein [Micromonospora maris]|uniref:hypothetical protein n=1 Tax=Micromonospora maris TaxID=1003110 RepID=UPI002E0D3900|nr:hypothetical protein OG712_20320 [Micromonospora maris]